MYLLCQHHRRRIKTEENAKVVASVGGGEEFIHFLAELAVLPRTILYPILQNLPRQNS